jgi:hypothetical protein
MSTSGFKEALDRSSEIELSVIGRTSGTNIERPVWFVFKTNILYLLPLNGSETNWYKNILKNSAIAVSVGNTKISANARPITDSSRVRQIVDAFRFKYGPNDVKKYYTKFDTIVEIPLS